jgi:hypothetical protein
MLDNDKRHKMIGAAWLAVSIGAGIAYFFADFYGAF